MAISRNKKKEIFEALERIFVNSEAVIFINFHGMKVAEANELRRRLNRSSIGYRVAKKTILRKVLEKREFSGAAFNFPAELAVAYGIDSVEASREVYDCEKKLEKKISILGGIFFKRYIPREEIVSLALIPPREVLISELLCLFSSPLRRFAIIISKVAEKVG